MVSQEYYIDLEAGHIPVAVHVAQYDTGSRTIIFHLVHGSVPFVTQSGYTATIQGTKPDRRAFQYEAELDEDKAIIDITEQMSCVVGNVYCNITIMNGDEVLGTSPFVIVVQRSGISDDSVVSSSDIPLIQQAVEFAASNDAEAWAKGTRNGVPVSSDDPTYQNNSKFYSEQSVHTTFRSLTDVDFTGAANNYVPTYNSTTDKLEMKPGGGGGGTSDYDDLTNKPSINNVTLSGNKTSSDLGLVAAESGKGLSTNDYTTTEKNKLAGIAANAEVNVQSDWNQSDSNADDYIKNKPTSLGHTMVNNAGTELTQRSKLKTVGGLNATDDSVNDTTEITDVVEEVPWATWQSYPSEEAALQAHPNCVVTGAPDCDGDIEIENMHLAWSNQSPTTDFASQQITLNTDGNYNRIIVEFCFSTSFVNLRKSVDFQKGNGAFMDLTYAYPTNSNYSRTITPVSDTKIQFDTCYSGGAQSDNMLVPIAVYTYKDDLTAKIQAIARNVSTEASKCMLDENTSVGDAIKGLKLAEQSFSTVGSWVSISNATITNLSKFKSIEIKCYTSVSSMATLFLDVTNGMFTQFYVTPQVVDGGVTYRFLLEAKFENNQLYVRYNILGYTFTPTKVEVYAHMFV